MQNPPVNEPEQQAEPEVPDWGSPPAHIAFEPEAADEELPPLLHVDPVPVAPPVEEGARSGNVAGADLGGQPPAPAPAPVAVAEAVAVPAPASPSGAASSSGDAATASEGGAKRKRGLRRGAQAQHRRNPEAHQRRMLSRLPGVCIE